MQSVRILLAYTSTTGVSKERVFPRLLNSSQSGMDLGKSSDNAKKNSTPSTVPVAVVGNGHPTPETISPINVGVGAFVDVLVPENIYTCVHLAAVRGHLDILRTLVNEARYTHNLIASDGVSPLVLAAQEGHTDIVNFLLDKEREAVPLRDYDGLDDETQVAQASSIASARTGSLTKHDLLLGRAVGDADWGGEESRVQEGSEQTRHKAAAASDNSSHKKGRPRGPLFDSTDHEVGEQNTYLDVRFLDPRPDPHVDPIFVAIASSELAVAATLLESGLYAPNRDYEKQVGVSSLLLATVYALQLESIHANSTAKNGMPSPSTQIESGAALRLIRLLLLRNAGAAVDEAATRPFSCVVNGAAIEIVPGMSPLRAALQGHAFALLRLLLVHASCAEYAPDTLLLLSLGVQDVSEGANTSSSDVANISNVDRNMLMTRPVSPNSSIACLRMAPSVSATQLLENKNRCSESEIGDADNDEDVVENGGKQQQKTGCRGMASNQGSFGVGTNDLDMQMLGILYSASEARLEEDAYMAALDGVVRELRSSCGAGVGCDWSGASNTSDGSDARHGADESTNDNQVSSEESWAREMEAFWEENFGGEEEGTESGFSLDWLNTALFDADTSATTRIETLLGAVLVLLVLLLSVGTFVVTTAPQQVSGPRGGGVLSAPRTNSNSNGKKKKKAGGSVGEPTDQQMVGVLHQLSAKLKTQYAKAGSAEPSRKVKQALAGTLAEIAATLGSSAPPQLQQLLAEKSRLNGHGGLRPGGSGGKASATEPTAQVGTANVVPAAGRNRVVRQQDVNTLTRQHEQKVAELQAAVAMQQKKNGNLQSLHARSVERHATLERLAEKHAREAAKYQKVASTAEEKQKAAEAAEALAQRNLTKVS